MLPGQQVIAHNLWAWDPVCVCLVILVFDCLHSELFVTSPSYQRRIPQSRDFAPSNESLNGGNTKGSHINIFTLRFTAATMTSRRGPNADRFLQVMQP